jgi:hypothetical protein
MFQCLVMHTSLDNIYYVHARLAISYRGHRDSTMSPSHNRSKKGPRISTAGVGAGATASNLFLSPTAGAATASLRLLRRWSCTGRRTPTAAHQPLYALASATLPPVLRRRIVPYGGSSGTLNLNQGYGGQERAPSAYLDDLFGGENGPPVPGHEQRRGN